MRLSPSRHSRRRFLTIGVDLYNDETIATLPIFLVSYGWLQPSHPDPKGVRLRLLASVLESALKNSSRSKMLGVFWDFGSLHQHPTNGSRTKDEEALFKEGLRFLSPLFSHPRTVLLMITKFPADYPAGYDLPDQGANTSNYLDRGWCFAESATAMLASHLVLDISLIDDGHAPTMWTAKNHGLVYRCVAGRRPPLLPAQFSSKHSRQRRSRTGKTTVRSSAGCTRTHSQRSFALHAT